MKLRLKGQPVLKFPIIVSFRDEDSNTFQFGYGFNDARRIATIELRNYSFTLSGGQHSPRNSHASLHNDLNSAINFVFGLVNGFPVSIWYVDQQTRKLELQYTFNSEQELKSFKESLGT